MKIQSSVANVHHPLGINKPESSQQTNEVHSPKQEGNPQPSTSHQDTEFSEETAIKRIALASLDSRNRYKFDRPIDSKPLLTRSYFQLAEMANNYSVENLTKHYIKKGLTLIPGMSTLMHLHEANQSRKDLKSLRQKTQMYNPTLKPIFEHQREQIKLKNLMELLDLVDMTPYEIASKLSSLAKISGSLVNENRARLSRIDIADLQQQIKQPKPNDVSYQEWQQEKEELIEQRNLLILDLLTSDPAATDSFIQLLDSVKPSDSHSLENEFRHHISQTVTHHRTPNDTSEAENIKPSAIKTQVQSELAIKALKKVHN